MKDLKEMFDALLAGETLVQNDFELKANNYGEIIGIDNFTMLIPHKWLIKPKSKKWYEKLNGRSVLCKTWDNVSDKKFDRFIVKYDARNLTYNYIDEYDDNWENAIPLTTKEIQVYLDNAKDIENNVF